MMKPSFYLGLAMVLALSSCAKSPESIQAAYVSDVPFKNWSCSELGEESLRLSSALAVASEQQENARTNDTIGVILIGLPVSSLSGDNIAPQIAQLKGEAKAVQSAMRFNNCGRRTATQDRPWDNNRTGEPDDVSSPSSLGTVQLYGTRLASFEDSNVAHSSWEQYTQNHPELGQLRPNVERIRKEDGTIVYYLSGTTSDKSQADAICTKVRLDGQYCEVIDLTETGGRS